MADVSVPSAVVANVHVPPAAVADVPAVLGVTSNSTVSTISIIFTPISLTRPIQSICRARNSHKLGILTLSPCKASLAEKVEKMNKNRQPKIKFVQEATPDIYVETTSSIASNRTASIPDPHHLSNRWVKPSVRKRPLTVWRRSLWRERNEKRRIVVDVYVMAKMGTWGMNNRG